MQLAFWPVISQSNASTGPQIDYSPGFELAGATPAFVPAVLTFVEVMRRWADAGITVDAVHEHVVSACCPAAPNLQHPQRQWHPGQRPST